MPHAPGEDPPRRPGRKTRQHRAPPPTNPSAQPPRGAPPSYPRGHTYYPKGRLGGDGSTSDEILKLGHGPLNLATPSGKQLLPPKTRPKPPPPLQLPPIFTPPAAGATRPVAGGTATGGIDTTPYFPSAHDIARAAASPITAALSPVTAPISNAVDLARNPGLLTDPLALEQHIAGRAAYSVPPFSPLLGDVHDAVAGAISDPAPNAPLATPAPERVDPAVTARLMFDQQVILDARRRALANPKTRAQQLPGAEVLNPTERRFIDTILTGGKTQTTREQAAPVRGPGAQPGTKKRRVVTQAPDPDRVVAGAQFLQQQGVELSILDPGAKRALSGVLLHYAMNEPDKLRGLLPGFAQTSVLDPQTKAWMLALAHAYHVDVKPNENEAELVLDVTNAMKGHPSYVSELLGNIPSSVANLAIGTPAFIYSAGAATQDLARGDTTSSQQLLKGLAGYYGKIISDPFGQLRRDPAGTVLALAPGFKHAGEVAGRSIGLEPGEEIVQGPRSTDISQPDRPDVVPPIRGERGGQVVVRQRSTNAFTRPLQVATDFLSRGPRRSPAGHPVAKSRIARAAGRALPEGISPLWNLRVRRPGFKLASRQAAATEAVMGRVFNELIRSEPSRVDVQAAHFVDAMFKLPPERILGFFEQRYRDMRELARTRGLGEPGREGYQNRRSDVDEALDQIGQQIETYRLYVKRQEQAANDPAAYAELRRNYGAVLERHLAVAEVLASQQLGMTTYQALARAYRPRATVRASELAQQMEEAGPPPPMGGSRPGPTPPDYEPPLHPDTAPKKPPPEPTFRGPQGVATSPAHEPLGEGPAPHEFTAAAEEAAQQAEIYHRRGTAEPTGGPVEGKGANAKKPRKKKPPPADAPEIVVQRAPDPQVQRLVDDPDYLTSVADRTYRQHRARGGRMSPKDWRDHILRSAKERLAQPSAEEGPPRPKPPPPPPPRQLKPPPREKVKPLEERHPPVGDRARAILAAGRREGESEAAFTTRYLRANWQDFNDAQRAAERKKKAPPAEKPSAATASAQRPAEPAQEPRTPEAPLRDGERVTDGKEEFTVRGTPFVTQKGVPRVRLRTLDGKHETHRDVAELRRVQHETALEALAHEREAPAAKPQEQKAAAGQQAMSLEGGPAAPRQAADEIDADLFGGEPPPRTKDAVRQELDLYRLAERDLSASVARGAGTRVKSDLKGVREKIAELEAELAGQPKPPTDTMLKFEAQRARNAKYKGMREADEFALMVRDAAEKVPDTLDAGALIGAVDDFHAALKRKGTGKTKGRLQAEANLVAHLEKVNAPDDLIQQVLRTRSNSERFRREFDLLTRNQRPAEDPAHLMVHRAFNALRDAQAAAERGDFKAQADIIDALAELIGSRSAVRALLRGEDLTAVQVERILEGPPKAGAFTDEALAIARKLQRGEPVTPQERVAFVMGTGRASTNPGVLGKKISGGAPTPDEEWIHSFWAEGQEPPLGPEALHRGSPELSAAAQPREDGRPSVQSISKDDPRFVDADWLAADEAWRHAFFEEDRDPSDYDMVTLDNRRQLLFAKMRAQVAGGKAADYLQRDYVGGRVRYSAKPRRPGEPSYVPFVRPGRGRTDYVGTFEGTPVTEAPERILGGRGRQFSGGRLARGDFEHLPEATYASIAQTYRVHHYTQLVRLMVAKHGMTALPGTQYDPRRWVLLNVGSQARRGMSKVAGRRTISGLVENNESMKQAILDYEERLFDAKLAREKDPDMLEKARVIYHQSKRFDPAMNRGDYAHLPDSGHWVLLPRPIHDLLVQEGKGSTISMNRQLQTMQKVTRSWRTATLYARPAWLVMNVVGNTANVVLAGGTMEMLRGLKAITLRRKLPDVPAGAAYQGFAAQMLPHVGREGNVRAADFGVRHAARQFLDARSMRDLFDPKSWPKTVGDVWGIYTSALRDANVAIENAQRRTIARAEMRRIAKGRAGGEARIWLRRVTGQWREVNRELAKHMDDILTDQAAADRVLKVVQDFLGNFSHGVPHPYADLVMPFWRWSVFVAKLGFYTLPVHYPGRASLLAAMSNLGAQASAQQGSVPERLAGALPISGSASNRLVAKITSAWPLATLAGFTYARPGEGPGLGGFLGGLNPAVDVVSQVGIGQSFPEGDLYTPSGGKPGLASKNPVVAGRTLVNALERSVPLVSAFEGRGLAATNTVFDTAGQALGIPGVKEQKDPRAFSGTRQPTYSGLLRFANYMGLPLERVNYEQYDIATIKALATSVSTAIRNKAKNETRGMTAQQQLAWWRQHSPPESSVTYWKYLVSHPDKLARIISHGANN